ncbi:efflux RND transporter periplasmic adaptor subunit [Niveibacterium sp. SC-1]|uniref:efflux RND transporter periplasmic adaptor subunit n=1 Tax=Niveibacterium sp. SC-1 TaxID=3135646 RepID=UPI00311F405D
MKKRTLLVLVAVVGAIGAGIAYSNAKKKDTDTAKRGFQQNFAVVTAPVTLRDVPQVLRYSGFVTPVSSVEIRAQTTSTVRELRAREGQNVAKGEVLFVLDSRADAAATDKLVAQLAKDRALLADARRTLQRNEELLARNFVSATVVDTSRSNVDALEATVKADQAAIDESKVTEGYSRIVAPQGGRVGTINVRVGSLVQPGSAQPLTVLTQLDPVDVSFAVPESELGPLLTAQHAGDVAVSATLDQTHATGKLSFIDSAVDSTIGSLRAKARFDNPKLQLWPGALVQVELTLNTLHQATTVPLAAVQVGADRQFVYRLGADSKVEAVPVKIVYQTSELAVVDGVAPGGKVVVEGGQNLRPGASVHEAGKGGWDGKKGAGGQSGWNGQKSGGGGGWNGQKSGGGSGNWPKKDAQAAGSSAQ